MNGLMATRIGSRLRRTALGVSAAAVLAVMAPGALPADAHCDSVEGPVVAAARKSLDRGDVKYVLAYVQPAAEAELTAAFRQSRDVRRRAPAARELADRYFFETAVRLHRAGEGAPYSGLKAGMDLGPALEAAESEVLTGKPGETRSVLGQALQAGLDERWHAVESARVAAGRNANVSTLRAQAEAELAYETYVHEVYGLITADDHASESKVAESAAAGDANLSHSAQP